MIPKRAIIKNLAAARWIGFGRMIAVQWCSSGKDQSWIGYLELKVVGHTNGTGGSYPTQKNVIIKNVNFWKNGVLPNQKFPYQKFPKFSKQKNLGLPIKVRGLLKQIVKCICSKF